jgi:hypothetical protein
MSDEKPKVENLEQQEEAELTPEQAEQVTGGSNGNFPPGQFPSGNPAHSPGTLASLS